VDDEDASFDDLSMQKLEKVSEKVLCAEWYVVCSKSSSKSSRQGSSNVMLKMPLLTIDR